ncbi:MAG: RNA polymerase sigma factor [Planctomycetota bacterium]
MVDLDNESGESPAGLGLDHGSATEDWDNLVSSSVAGDQRAQATLVSAVALLSRSYYRRRGLLPGDAEELAISTISDVIMSLDKYRPGSGHSFKRWLYGICRRKRADEFRQRYRLGVVTLNESQLANPVVPEPAPEVSSVPLEALADALAMLTAEDRHLIAARHRRVSVEYQQLALELNISPALCRKRFERAMKRLRRVLEQDPRTAAWRAKFVTTAAERHSPIMPSDSS